MASRKQNPAGAESAGLGNVIFLAGSDTRVNTAPPTDPQVAIIDAVVADAAEARSYLLGRAQP
jgi:hypothetical protein